jgi:N-acetylglutamate synthase-like GNAT family acetyltransferase
LIEQIDRRKFTVDEFLQANVNLLYSENYIFEVILNEENIIIGFVNYTIDSLNKEVYINILSIDRSYQCDSRTLKFVIDAFKKLSKTLGYSVVWHTFKPGFFIKAGFAKLKGELLEYTAC